MYFGLATPSGEVTAEQFAAFIDRVVTPVFPSGLTLMQAVGQWQDPDGSIVRENSRVLIILHPASADTWQSLVAIARVYSNEFEQESVLITQSAADRVDFIGADEGP